MNLLLCGINHKTAPVEVRERFAVPEPKLGEASRALALQPEVEEAMVLSTCNRVELIARMRAGANGAGMDAFLRDYMQLAPADYENCLYRHHGAEAVRHLFRVAASLDSLVVGEPQILGQVKQAHAAARAAGAMNGELDALVTRAFTVAKRVRTETAIGSSAVSVASVAVELAKKIFGSLAGRSVYLVGAGKMSELAARHLISQGAARILVANRTREHAMRLASLFDGEVVNYDDLYATADRADIVITSTGAPHAIFRREHGEAFMARRKNRPMFFIDIAVPRDVDPEMNKLNGIFVYDIDDLQSVVATHVADRRREAERAEAIVNLEVEKFLLRLNAQEVTPTIISLQERLELLRKSEVERMRGRLGKLSAEQEAAVEAMTRAIVNKVLHAPMAELKRATQQPGSPEAAALVESVRRLFDLREHETMAEQAEEFETAAKRARAASEC